MASFPALLVICFVFWGFGCTMGYEEQANIRHTYNQFTTLCYEQPNCQDCADLFDDDAAVSNTIFRNFGEPSEKSSDDTSYEVSEANKSRNSTDTSRKKPSKCGRSVKNDLIKCCEGMRDAKLKQATRIASSLDYFGTSEASGIFLSTFYTLARHMTLAKQRTVEEFVDMLQHYQETSRRRCDDSDGVRNGTAGHHRHGCCSNKSRRMLLSKLGAKELETSGSLEYITRIATILSVSPEGKIIHLEEIALPLTSEWRRNTDDELSDGLCVVETKIDDLFSEALTISEINADDLQKFEDAYTSMQKGINQMKIAVQSSKAHGKRKKSEKGTTGSSDVNGTAKFVVTSTFSNTGEAPKAEVKDAAPEIKAVQGATDGASKEFLNLLEKTKRKKKKSKKPSKDLPPSVSEPLSRSVELFVSGRCTSSKDRMCVFSDAIKLANSDLPSLGGHQASNCCDSASKVAEGTDHPGGKAASVDLFDYVLEPAKSSGVVLMELNSNKTANHAAHHTKIAKKQKKSNRKSPESTSSGDLLISYFDINNETNEFNKLMVFSAVAVTGMKASDQLFRDETVSGPLIFFLVAIITFAIIGVYIHNARPKSRKGPLNDQFKRVAHATDVRAMAAGSADIAGRYALLNP